MAVARRRATVAFLVLGMLGLAGCEDSAGGFGAGLGRAIALLLLVGLVLPATLIGLVVWLVTSSRRRREGRGPR